LSDILNPEFQAARAQAKLESLAYGGDAVPIAQVDFGPGILPAVLGRPWRLGEDTVWFDEDPLKDADAVEQLVLNRGTPIYRSFLKTTELLLLRAKGRYTVALGDIGSTFDVLAALYQRESLLMDIALHPQRVERLLARVGAWWREAVLENLWQISSGQSCISTWIPIVNSRTWYAQLSEFSAMISGDDFEKFSLPALAREAELFEQIVFNMDGDNYARHLPGILKIPKLHAIDWAPTLKYVAPGVSHKIFTEPQYLNVARQVQKHVKLIINGIPPWQVAEVLEHISPDGVFFIVECADVDEGESFLAEARTWMRT
jgi:hypothetical protein